MVAAVAGPVAVAALLVPFRDHLAAANAALILVVVTVAVAATGWRLAAAVAAISAALAFDFFLTRPYQSLRITRASDLTTELLLLVVGLAVGELAARGQHQRQAADERRGDVRRLHDLAERVARGDAPDLLVEAVAGELGELLTLRDCTFTTERPSSHGARIEPDASVRIGTERWAAESLGLPTRRVDLPVRSGGRTVGTFVLTPTPGQPVDLDHRLVAVALADQVGAALSARPQPFRPPPRRAG